MHTPLVGLTVALACAAVVSGQTTVTIQAATPVATLTRSAVGDSFEVTAQGQTIGPYPSNVFQTTSQSAGSSWLSATTIVYPTQPYLGGVGLNVFERASVRGAVGESAGSSASAGPAGAAFGPHEVLARFAAAPGTVGEVIVSWRNNLDAVGPNGSGRCRVDVDDDGVAEFDQAAAEQFVFPYTIGASGTVDVRVANTCRSDGDGSGATIYTWTELWIGFRPSPTTACSFTPYGQGCAGVQLGGNQLVVGNTRTILMLATGCFPSSPVIVALGDQQLALPLANGCSLLCNAQSLELRTADAGGNATATWNLPASVAGVHNVQFLPLSGAGGVLTLRASNGVRIDCN